VNEEYDPSVGAKWPFIIAADGQYGVKLRTVMAGVHTEADEDQFFVRSGVKNG
jgi:hypothetical protein